MFHKILIANRGEIACRIVRTCRRLGVGTVAVYSEADASSLHRTTADESVAIGPAAVQASYLDADRLIDSALRCGADAIHPGYGFLSESADFASKVQDAGLRFIGPPPEVLELVGDKMRARRMASNAGVTPVPGAMEPLQTVGDAIDVARRVGWPVIVKAVGGGGGIGMQIVQDESSLERAFRTCSDRGKTAFGDPRVYLESYIPNGSHVEVQILCDGSGGAVALGERECSVQRRHQKILEESPSPTLDALHDGARIRADLHGAALRIARASGYSNAGTCEFLLSPTGELYFLEVNARLQVEHPVTEMVTGLDLVEEQLRIASGGAVSDLARGATVTGHAIEVRLYAENPDRGFFPSPGKIESLTWPEGEGLRIETGVRAGDAVTPYYDPLIAKIIAHGGSRDEARERLAEGLTSMEVAPLVTNLPFLRRILADETFVKGRYDTGYVERLMGKKP